MSLSRILSAARVVSACIWACACGDGATDPPDPPPDPPRPTTVTVSPATSELTSLGATVQLSAEVRDQNGQVMVVAVTWSSNNASVATVGASGLVTAAGNGTATVTATAGAVSGSATVTVAQQVSAVEVTPATGIMLPGTTLQLAAEAQDANGHAVAGSEFAWASSDTAVAVVDTTGLVTGITLGEVEVSAASSGATGRAQLEVVEPAPTTIAVSPDTVILNALGSTRRLTAEVQDQAGRPMADEVVTWAASDTLVATVDASGLVTAVANGAATITATSGVLSADAAVEVMQVVSRVVVSPSADSVHLGDSLRLVAEALDGNRHPVAGAAFTWSSGDAAIATVDTSGLVRGVAEGVAEITAATGNRRGVSRITVFNPDRAPLVALYNATNGPEWVRNDNWLTDMPLWTWYGVDTDADDRVVSVNLSGRPGDRNEGWIPHGLAGTIPSELGSLTRLRHLVLWGNALSGPIPAPLGSLGELTHLDLAANELTGTIPPEFGELSKLTVLGLQDNALEGAIPPELGSLTALEWLRIERNRLTGTIPSELGSLRRLTHLWLSENDLSGPIPSELGNLAELQHLSFGRNKLTGPIPSELGKLRNLIHLWLSENDLFGPLPSELGNLARLEYLALFANRITGPIPSELGNLASLERLALAWNNLTGPIPREVGMLTELAELGLQGNDLGGPIPTEIGNLTRLTRLNLAENALTGGIPGEIGRTSLAELDLNANDLTGPIPAELGNLTGLKTLSLGENSLSGPIPAELGALGELTVLALGGNALEGPIPARLGELEALERLLLEDNDFEGTIPPEFGALTSLEELNLTNNTGLTGALPAELTALARLEVLLAGRTELCAPSEPDFETWLLGVYRNWIARCPQANPATAYLTQVVQSREFPVPLVAGREALLRVFVTARQATRTGIPPVRARFYVDDRETHVRDIPGKRSPIPTRVDESGLGRSANAVIPRQVLQPGLEMVIEVDPEGTLDPGLGVAKRIPETGRTKIDVQTMPLLELTLIPFLWSEDPDSSIVELVREMAADPANHEMLRETRTLLPLRGLRVSAHEPVLTSTYRSQAILDETNVIRTLEGGTGHYMGMVAGEVTDSLGGLALGPGWAAFAQDDGATIAHELGHNMSLAHAPCGGADYPDPAFPRVDGSIGAWGYDFGARALVDPSYSDIMGFCPPREWISDYHFAQALRFRLRDEGHSALPDRLGRARSLLVWGGVNANGTPFLEPALVVDAPPLLPDAAGDHRLAGLTADGTKLFSLSFAMPEVADGDGSSGFAFAVPVQPSWAGALASITLSGPGGSDVLDSDSERAVAIVRNPRSGQVHGFLRGAPAEDAFQVAAMVAPGAAEAVEVLFSRGIPEAVAWQR